MMKIETTIADAGGGQHEIDVVHRAKAEAKLGGPVDLIKTESIGTRIISEWKRSLATDPAPMGDPDGPDPT